MSDLPDLPHNVQAENDVIGVLFLKPDYFPKVMGIIEPEHFIHDANRAIFQRMKELHLDGKAFEYMEFDGCASPFEIGLRLDGRPVHDPTQAAKHVRDLWVRRQFVKLGYELMERASKSEEIDGLATDFQNKAFALLKGREQGIYELSEAIQAAITEIEECRNQNTFSGVLTHIPQLNKYIGGFRKGNLILLGARPSLGKTALAVNFTYHLIQERKAVLFVSAEMSKEDIAKRMLAIRSQVPGEAIINNPKALSVDDIEKIRASVHGFQMDAMAILDEPYISVERIFSAAEMVKRKMGVLDLVVIDYVQLLSQPQVGKHVRSMNDYIAEISKTMKNMARFYQVPILALSQLNREGDDQPKLSTLRGSGQLEQDADVVLMLYKDTEGHKLRIAKSRNGRRGFIDLNFYPETMFFTAKESEARQ